MIEVRQTDEFRLWLGNLKDKRAARFIAARIVRTGGGNFGDVRPVGEGVIELRIDFGPGYRLYVVNRGPKIIILLCGGDKGSQARDIANAKRLARKLEE
jgi:putative addiction module killer protein